ncbi:MAG: FAD-binding protein, partial [Verrucomicrobiae bacterium]|nr:FAD-binding protein [Verrucomicrobiae bacterium]
MAIEALRRIVGDGNVLTKEEELAVYAYDGTAMLSERPLCVVMVESTEHVAAVLRLANERKLAVVPRGSGTGLSGGSVPSAGSVVLCTVKMNRILEVDARNLTMRVECGALTQAISDAADKAGLFYPPDPGSMKISTIGGNVAYNSGGLRGLKYGITRNYVMGLKVVLADGTVLDTGNKCVKDVAGYTIKDLFVGSEGTLGIITEVLLRLIPKPKSKRTLLATYGKMTDAAETISAIIAAKIIPCTLEFLDAVTINCVEDYAKIGLPRDAEAILLMETDGHPAVVEEEAEAMAEIAKKNGARDVRIAADAIESATLAAA